MQYCKLQIGCLLIVLYIAFIYIREKLEYEDYKRAPLFERFLAVCVFSIIFDAITAYTVNHLAEFPDMLNRLFHMCFLLGLNSVVFVLFWYLLDMTKGIPDGKGVRRLLQLPFLISVLVVICFLPELEFRKGQTTNYSMGVSAYSCYFMVGVYLIAATGIFIKEKKKVGKHERLTVSTCLIVTIGCLVGQMIFPEILLTSIVPASVVLGAYLNQENPVFTKMKKHHDEMVMGFSALVESRDSNTGEHIYRTTAYVSILARYLQKNGFYKETLSPDYIEELITAAPLHDIGKIAIPDAVLQKPGKLTEDEYAIMKTHAPRGGEIIQEIFGKEDKMAYEVAMYHHEKWNGRGYPEGLSGEEIPLCARIMAIADVFDAVSSKRCYKEAFPLSKCFAIIEEGSGQDFDPIAAKAFLACRSEVEEVYEKLQNSLEKEKDFLKDTQKLAKMF